MRTTRLLLALLWFVSGAALAAGGGWKLEHAPINPTDVESLQAGARTFVNYCLNCHGAEHVRYNQLTRIGLTEQQIKDNLLFTADKVTEMMKTSMRPDDAREWFGAPPPDLSVIARVRGPDWLYTYMRTFYRDASTITGWNNAVYPNVGMPHTLWQLQGERAGKWVSEKDAHGHDVKRLQLEPAKGGSMSALDYDRTIADLVNFLAWMGEPAQLDRKRIGYYVLMALAVLMLISYFLKAAYWKDVH
jgi:ubiquinol-cytochrome c reductase cytochrome c1 subunit